MIPASHGLPRRWRIGVASVAALLFLWAWPSLSRLFWQLLFALLLSAAALPLARWMEKRLARPLAAAAAVGALALSMLGMIALLTPHVLSQAALLLSEAPRLLTQLQEAWKEISQREWVAALGIAADAPARWLSQAAIWLGDSLPGLIAGIGAGVDAVSRAFLSPLLAYYFLKDREAFTYRLSLWIPLSQRRRALVALKEMRREAGGYIRGQMLVALAVAVLTSAGLLIVGIPAWLVLGLLMGLCELIPYVGPLIGGVPIVVFSLPRGLNATLWALGVSIAVQQVEGFFLSPWLMGGATGLHPIYVLLLLSAGGLLWGLPGMVAALPAFVCIRGAARVLWETRKQEKYE